MKINQIAIKNFRLLEKVNLYLEDVTTVIVGRNNSGKTSLTELFRHLLSYGQIKFKLEDFSLAVHELFWNAFVLYRSGKDEAAIRKVLPQILISLHIEYEMDEVLGPLADFVIDLDESCTTAQINIHYSLADGKITQLFQDLDLDDERETFFKALKERIPDLFEAKIEAQDPNDSSNRKPLNVSNLRLVLQFGFINAQRAVDSESYREKPVLGKIFEKLFIETTSDAASNTDQATAAALKAALDGAQSQIDNNFNEQLVNLAPTFELFGYPGLTDPKLRTETILRVEQLFSNHTKVHYLGANGVNLPESYNGLGPRNLIFILLKLFEFFKSFTNQQPIPAVHLVFIEEPEAHLHPQMQSVFIRQLEYIRGLFGNQYNDGNSWPVQFIVTTHSSHIANEANFDSIRYFLTKERIVGESMLNTEVRDLRTGLGDKDAANQEFLHKYMTLTRCDLLFADRAILIEGTSERLMLPKMIQKFDKDRRQDEPKLGNQYLTIMEVGGAYAHKFFKLLDFLDLKTLVITDLDTVDSSGKCKVSAGTHSSNACVNDWFKIEGNNPTKNELLNKSENDKIKGNRRIAFQIPHLDGDACGRSFEDAFILANPEIFEVSGDNPEDQEEQSWDKANKVNKTDFALKYAILDTEWIIPRYIKEGLEWLALETSSTKSFDVETNTTGVEVEERKGI